MTTITRNVLCLLLLSMIALAALNADPTATAPSGARAGIAADLQASALGAASAEHHPLLPTVSVSAFTEVWNGDVLEYVWENNYMLSELIWTISDIQTAGASAALVWCSGLFIGGEFSTALSSKTGTLDDSDWKNIKYGDPYTKTHYSHHDTTLVYAETARLDAGWRLTPDLPAIFPVQTNRKTQPFSLTPTIGIRYISWKWDARDGYTQYPPESEPIQFSGLGISYSQEILIPNARIGIYIPALGALSGSFSATVSPFVQCYAVDNHHLRNLTFHDLLEGGTFFEAEMSVAFNPFKNISLYVSASSSTIRNLRGSTAEQTGTSARYSWSYYSSGDGGGAELLAERIRIGISASF